MAHLSKFGLENFRVFKDMTELEFAPITVFTGANSSGKSSVIKALLLLKDNISKDFIFEDIVSLDFTQGFHHLSNFNENINRNGKKKEMKFRLPFTFLFIQDKMTIELTYTLDKSNEIKNGTLVKLEVFSSDGNSIISFSKNDKVWKPTINFSYLREEFDVFLIKYKTNGENKKRKKLLESKGKLTEDEQKELKKLNVEIGNFNDYYSKYYINKLLSRKKHIYFDIDPQIKLPEINFNKFINFISKPLLHTPFSFLSYEKKDFIDFLSKGGFGSVEKETYKDLGFDLNKVSDSEYVYYHLKSKCEDFAKDAINSIGDENISSIEELLRVISKAESLGIKNISFEYSQSDDKGLNNIAKKLEGYLGVLLPNYKNELFIDLPIDVIQNLNKHSRAIYSYYLRIVEYILTKKDESLEYRVLIDLIYRINRNVGLDPLTEFIDKYSELNKLFIGYNPLKKYFEQYIREGFINSVNNTSKGFQSINFIEAVRANTQRYYSFTSQGTSFNDLLREYSLLGFNSESEQKSFVNKWLNEFEIGSELVTSIIEGYGSKVSIDKTNLADLGYGVSQFLPLLIKIAVVARKNYDVMPITDSLSHVLQDWPNNYYSSILIIEEPETNLHPKLQSKLADMFVDAAKKFNIQFIVETHSEYLIRKLQYLTAKNEIKPEDTAIYYFHNPSNIPEGENQVKRIEIRSDGMFKNDFGSGFFDESVMLTIDLLKIQSAN